MKIARYLALAASIGAGAACRRVVSRDAPEPASVQTAAVSPRRPVYPFSVIRGGVRSEKELAEALSGDPVAAGHYRDLAVADLRPVRLDRDQYAYVSYRHRDKIYWTAMAALILDIYLHYLPAYQR